MIASGVFRRPVGLGVRLITVSRKSHTYLQFLLKFKCRGGGG